MSLDAYMEKQDKTFGTFRSKFSLDTSNSRVASEGAIDSKHSRPPQSRSISASTFGDFLTSPVDQEEISADQSPSVMLCFSPQLRRLDIAPWEDVVDHLSISSKPDKDQKRNTKSRISIFRKFKRVTSSSSARKISAMEPGNSAENGTSPLPIPNQELSADQVPAQTNGPQSVSLVACRDPTQISTIKELMAPLGKPLDTDGEGSMVFAPVNPNIIQLRQPVTTIPEEDEYKVMKSSVSTPQLDYEFETPEKQRDRMSRMFDNLVFV